MDALTFAAAIIGSMLAGGGLAGLIGAFNARRKAKSEIAVNEAESDKKEAETADIITRAAGEAVKLMQSQLCQLESEVKTLRAENVELKHTQARHEREISELQELFDIVLAGAHVLHSQVIELNGTPKYRPPERRRK